MALLYCKRHIFSRVLSIDFKRIQLIRSPTKGLISDPSAFRAYYPDLYSSSHSFDTSACRRFLENLTLPKLSQEETVLIEEPFTFSELKAALLNMKKDITPELILNFWDELIKLFLTR